MKNNIKTIRQQKGISAVFIAKKLGISKSAVSQWESEKTLPSTANLIKIAEILKVNIEDLLK